MRETLHDCKHGELEWKKWKKIKKYVQKYKDEYSKQYSCTVKSSKSDEHAFCTICSADISISHILPYFVALSPFF